MHSSIVVSISQALSGFKNPSLDEHSLHKILNFKFLYFIYLYIDIGSQEPSGRINQKV